MQIYYPFNRSTADFSGQNNEGIPVNLDYGPDRAGVDSGAAFFNGTSGLVGSSFPANINVDFTVAGWALIRSMPTQNQLFSMVGIEDNSSLFFNAGLNGADSTLGFLFRSAAAYQSYTKSRIGRFDSTWFHFCITRSGQIQTQYINGVPTDTQTVAAGFVDGTDQSILIGGSNVLKNFGRGGYFQGLMDEVRLYNRAVTRAEIDTLAGLVQVGIKKDLSRSVLITCPSVGKIQILTLEPLEEVALYDLKGARLAVYRDVLPGKPFSFPAEAGCLVRVRDRSGNRMARLVSN